MSSVLTPSLQRKEYCLLKKVRELSLPGEIKVKPGDYVKAGTVVASAEFPGDLVILKIAEQLGIDSSDVTNSLLVKAGDEAGKGSKICEHRGLFGLFRNTFLSPYRGRIEFINKETGHVGLRLPSRTVDLKAYISGKVKETESKKSVTIETNCTYIQGIFGVGGEKSGKLKGLNVASDKAVSENDVPDSAEGCILYGGAYPDIQALRKACKCGATGFVTGSVDDKTLAEFLGYDLGIALTGNENIGMTLIITEGFGRLYFSEPVLKLLRKNEGKLASINGATQVRAGAVRPEIIIPQEIIHDSAAAGKLNQELSLSIGVVVRIIREPYFGKFARVLELPGQPEKLESGAVVRVLEAELTESGKRVKVPRADVEIV